MKTKRSYNLCPECDQPMLRKGQKRKHPDDYRHAHEDEKARYENFIREIKRLIRIRTKAPPNEECSG